MAPQIFARIFAQLITTVGLSLGRSFVNAYREAVKQGATKITRRMPLEEARQVIGVELPAAAEMNAETLEMVLERFQALHEANSGAEMGHGSPYLQQKIHAARIVLADHVKAELRKKGVDLPPDVDTQDATDGGASNTKSDETTVNDESGEAAQKAGKKPE